jgi:hypothetical protein
VHKLVHVSHEKWLWQPSFYKNENLISKFRKIEKKINLDVVNYVRYECGNFSVKYHAFQA